MSASNVKISPFCKAYDEIKTVVNDANRQIRNYNLKTIAKIIAWVTVFTLIGGFSIFVGMKMGLATELLGLPAFPSMMVGMYLVPDFISKNRANMSHFIENINKDIKTKLKQTSCIKQAVSLNNLENNGWFTIPKIEIDACDRANKRYQSDFRRYLPGFLQFYKPSNDKALLGLAAFYGVCVGALVCYRSSTRMD